MYVCIPPYNRELVVFPFSSRANNSRNSVFRTRLWLSRPLSWMSTHFISFSVVVVFVVVVGVDVDVDVGVFQPHAISFSLPLLVL